MSGSFLKLNKVPRWTLGALAGLLWVAGGLPLQKLRANGEPTMPLRVVVIGLSHGHAPRMVGRILAREDMRLVGVVEPRREARTLCQDRFDLSPDLFYDDLATVRAYTEVDAAMVMTSTREHAEVIAQCADQGIHVMVEKPLAISMEHARSIARAAEQGGIHVLVNYETIWMSCYQNLHAMVSQRDKIGDVRRMVALDGHRGPVNIGSPVLFREWLTDPELNGGGALFDFGCYGAAVMTWLLDNERPRAVMASTRRFQPEHYPVVDDDATLVLEYENAQGVVQASWNWPFPRKDMEVYGTGGYAIARGRGDELIVRETGATKESPVEMSPVAPAQSDPLSYLSAVVRGREQPSGPSSLALNLIVVEILEAARESARRGMRIELAATL